MQRSSDDPRPIDESSRDSNSQKPFRDAFNDLVERKSDVTRDTIPTPPPKKTPES